MIRKIRGGSFDDDHHLYLDEQGRFVPSLTQVLSLVKYSDYSQVPPKILRVAAARGTRCHFWTQIWDDEGGAPPPWTPPGELMRFEAYRQWEEREQFIAEESELPIIASVYGMKWGCTLDAVGTLAGQRTILEKKFTAKVEGSWGPQTAAQEMALAGSPTLGRYLRAVCHINGQGKANTLIYRDAQDAQRFIFALGVTWTRMDMGFDVRSEIMDLEEG